MNDDFIDNRYLEKQFIQREVENGYIEQADAYYATIEMKKKAQGSYKKARQVLENEVRAAAKWRVRYEHLDWFNPNGTNRGAFAKQIDAEIEMMCYLMWEEIEDSVEPRAPRGFTDGWSMDDLERGNPFKKPRGVSEIEWEVHFAKTRILGKYRVDTPDKLPKPHPEDETDPEVRGRYLAALQAVEELEADPDTQRALQRYTDAVSALAKARGTITPQSPEWIEYKAAEADRHIRDTWKLMEQCLRLHGT